MNETLSKLKSGNQFFSKDEFDNYDDFINVINELGYTLIDTRLLNAVNYRVPQKRERLFLIGIRNDLLKAKESFSWPEPGPDIYTLKDALKAGRLYESDVKPCEHHNYGQRKKKFLVWFPPVETGVLYR